MPAVTRKTSDFWKQLRADKVLKGKVYIGINEGSGGHDDADATVAEIARWLHDGTETIPARPFLSVPLSAERPEVQAIVKRVVTGVAQQKITMDQGLKLLGVWGRNEVVKYINEGVPPPNAESTIEAKGSSKPLIDTGQLKSSISFLIVEDEK